MSVVVYVHTFTEVFLAKGLHHGHMAMHSCLCLHTVTANLYKTRDCTCCHETVNRACPANCAARVHTSSATHVLLLVQGVEHATTYVYNTLLHDMYATTNANSVVASQCHVKLFYHTIQQLHDPRTGCISQCLHYNLWR